MDPAAIPWRTTRHPGVGIHFYTASRDSGRALVLIRMDPGHGYPRHQHRGQEVVLVVQGGYRDESGDHRAGEFVTYDDGSVHSPIALRLPGDTACVLLALAHGGVALLAG